MLVSQKPCNTKSSSFCIKENAIKKIVVFEVPSRVKISGVQIRIAKITVIGQLKIKQRIHTLKKGL